MLKMMLEEHFLSFIKGLTLSGREAKWLFPLKEYPYTLKMVEASEYFGD